MTNDRPWFTLSIVRWYLCHERDRNGARGAQRRDEVRFIGASESGVE
jgi:hypothetical protein